MDEADLILSFGYDEDVKAVVSHLPRIYQGMLMSATLSPELDDLKRVVLHRYVGHRRDRPTSNSNGLAFLLGFY
jgi:ATP-dependent RNA helicase DDX56/DBP9